jgi:hypothetical protein
LMVVFTSALDIRKGLFHGTIIWVHIGDMVAYYHPSLCRLENIKCILERVLFLFLRRQF